MPVARSLARPLSLLAAAGVLLTALCATAPDAGARPRSPAAGLAVVTSSVTANQDRPRFQYSVKNLPRGSTIALQRTFGTAHVYETVKKLKAGSNVTVTAPTLPQGLFRYRLYVSHKGSKVAVSNAVSVKSYGDIPLQAFCSTYSVQGANCDYNRTIQVGSTVFTPTVEFGTSTPPAWWENLTGRSTSCRSLSLSYAATPQGYGAVSSLQLVQGNADPQEASVPDGQIGTASFTLTGSSFILNAAQQPSEHTYLALAGSASCYTASGAP